MTELENKFPTGLLKNKCFWYIVIMNRAIGWQFLLFDDLFLV